MEKRKKVDAFILFQRLLAQKIEIKIDKVLKKASKVIYRRFRKANDYMEYSRKNKIIEKEKNKSDLELFFDYLNINDDQFCI